MAAREEKATTPAGRRLLRRALGPWDRRNAWSWLKLVLLILFIKGCVVDQYTIPSGSMEPTLHGDPRLFHGDRVLVNKWIYGPRVPFTTIRPWQWARPKRWDIAVFRAPEGASEHKILVKRVVGLPGEHIVLWWGQVYVNGELVAMPESLADKIYYYNDYDLGWEAEQAKNPADRAFFDELRARDPLRFGVAPESEYSVVPEGQYFVLGDNSLHSIDSRVYGWVPEDNLLGPVFAIWWPWNHIHDFSGFSKRWWGKLLLYGLPLSLLLYEIYRLVRKRARRESRNTERAPDADENT